MLVDILFCANAFCSYTLCCITFKARTYLSIAEPTDPTFLILLRQNLPTYTYPTFWSFKRDVFLQIMETSWRHFTGWLFLFQIAFIIIQLPEPTYLKHCQYQPTLHLLTGSLGLNNIR